MDLEQKYTLSVQALKDYAQQAGFNEVVLGLSGGIDSALVAVMCVDAFGADRVHAYMLPGPYSTDHSLTDAEELGANLGIKTEAISIVGPYEAFVTALEPAAGGKLSGLASENTQARCRMVCLMALSNTYGWMMVNTGNKSDGLLDALRRYIRCVRSHRGPVQDRCVCAFSLGERACGCRRQGPAHS